MYRISYIGETGHYDTVSQERVTEALRMLAINPFSTLLHTKKLRGAPSLFRLRVGQHRILYEVRIDQLVIVVIKVGDRKEVYRNL